MTERPEGGGFGGWPSEHENYGDSTRADWHTWDDGGGTLRRDVPDRNTHDDDDNDYARSENVGRGWQHGDRVRAVTSVGGIFSGRVPAGTEGRVVSVERGIFTDRLVVEFTNGYTETVKTSDVTYESGWY